LAGRFRPASLDALNFLLADVRGALGPYLNVFLVTQMHWSQSRVGVVTTAGGVLGLLLQTPAGAAIDATRAKRTLVVVALAVLGAGGLCIFALPRFWPVLAANAAMAGVGDVFGPAVSAITLGLVPAAALATRLGRNSAFDHAGNVAIAALAGLVGWAFSQRAVCFCWCRFSPSSRPVRPSAYRLVPSTMRARGVAGQGPAATHRGGPCSTAGRSSCSGYAPCCSTWRMRRCCRWSARSSPWPIRIWRPR
jgi:hypothetical protein